MIINNKYFIIPFYIIFNILLFIGIIDLEKQIYYNVNKEIKCHYVNKLYVPHDQTDDIYDRYCGFFNLFIIIGQYVCMQSSISLLIIGLLIPYYEFIIWNFKFDKKYSLLNYLRN